MCVCVRVFVLFTERRNRINRSKLKLSAENFDAFRLFCKFLSCFVFILFLCQYFIIYFCTQFGNKITRGAAWKPKEPHALYHELSQKNQFSALSATTPHPRTSSRPQPAKGKLRLTQVGACWQPPLAAAANSGSTGPETWMRG